MATVFLRRITDSQHRDLSAEVLSSEAPQNGKLQYYIALHFLGGGVSSKSSKLTLCGQVLFYVCDISYTYFNNIVGHADCDSMHADLLIRTQNPQCHGYVLFFILHLM